MDQNIISRSFTIFRQIEDASRRTLGYYQPFITFLLITLFLYFFTSITQYLNIDSMNSLDGSPIIPRVENRNSTESNYLKSLTG